MKEIDMPELPSNNNENYFQRYLSNDLIKTIFSYLDRDSLINMSQTNKKFNSLAKELRLYAVAANIVALINDAEVTKINNQNYFVCEKLRLKYPINKPNFYYEIIKKVITGFTFLEVVECLIKHKFNINFQGNLCLSLLHLMIYDIDATKLLIRAGVDVNAKDYYGNTALHYLISNVDLELLPQPLRFGCYMMTYQISPKDIALHTKYIELFAANKFNFKAQNCDHKSVADYVINRANLGGINEPTRDKLLMLIALPNDDILQGLKDKMIIKPYVFEILSTLKPECATELSEILAYNKKIRNIDDKNYVNEDTGYHNIFASDLVQHLVKNVPPEQQLVKIIPILCKALINGYTPWVGSTKDLYREIHSKISRDSHRKIVETILEVMPINQFLYQNKSLLHYMIILGDLDSITLLLERKANINCQDDNKRTALHTVVEEGYIYFSEQNAATFLKLIEIFEKNGFNFNLMNAHQQTVCQLLLIKCAKLNLTDSLRACIVKLLAVTVQNPLEVLKQYKLLDNKINDELNAYLENNLVSTVLSMLAITNPPKNSLPESTIQQNQVGTKRHHFSLGASSEPKKAKIDDNNDNQFGSTKMNSRPSL